jgi:hypothetical protein
MATTADDVWRLLGELIEAQKETERVLKAGSQETDRRFQEADRRFQETERLLREQSQETERLLREQSQETERLLREQSQETERLLREQSQKTEQLIQRVSQQIGKLGNRLGEFVEWQVRPAVVRLFQERGIEVHQFFPEVSLQQDGEGFEIDLLVINNTEAVLVEVKSKLSQADVDEHLERLAKFKQFMPRYGDVRAMGAVAGMVVPEEVARYAYRRGLFVLAQSGDSVVILNDDRFRPQTW